MIVILLVLFFYPRKTIVLLLFAATVLFGVSCRSKKPAAEKPVKNKEIAALSKKLNLEVTKKDNIKLYHFVADWLGTPHKLGACQKSAIDCSCFVALLYEQVYNTKLPRTAAEMDKQSKHVRKSNLEEGDLVFFKIKSSKVSHVGVYLKDGWFAHVSTTKGVMINNLEEAYYEKHYYDGGKP